MIKGKKFERISISKTEYKQLKKAERKVKSAKVLKRIQAFKLMYLSWKYGAIADFLCVVKNTISEWIKLYKKGGIAAVISLNYKGGQPRLTAVQLNVLKEKAAKGEFPYAKDVKYCIEKEYGIVYNLKHVHLLCKKNFVYPLRKQD